MVLTAIGLDLFTLTVWETMKFSTKPPKKLNFLQGGQQQPRGDVLLFAGHLVSPPFKNGITQTKSHGPTVEWRLLVGVSFFRGPMASVFLLALLEKPKKGYQTWLWSPCGLPLNTTKERATNSKKSNNGGVPFGFPWKTTKERATNKKNNGTPLGSSFGKANPISGTIRHPPSAEAGVLLLGTADLGRQKVGLGAQVGRSWDYKTNMCFVMLSKRKPTWDIMGWLCCCYYHCHYH